MRRISLFILVMASLLFWSSGWARLSHERIEEYGCEKTGELERAKGDGWPRGFSDKSHTPHKSHHEAATCVVCQTLSALAAHQPAPPTMAAPALPRAREIILTTAAAPTLWVERGRNARGPPQGII